MAALLVTGVAVRRDGVGPRERAAFERVNGLPDTLYGPGWILMQAGALGAAPAAAAVAVVTGHRRLGLRLLLSGVGAWLAGKLLKRRYRRPRPRVLVPDGRFRGRDATGLGYVSGHAGVAVALMLAALPELPRPARRAAVVAAPLVGLCRIYVGAHLPLDVVGGAATGVAVDAAVDLTMSFLDLPAPPILGMSLLDLARGPRQAQDRGTGARGRAAVRGWPA